MALPPEATRAKVARRKRPAPRPVYTGSRGDTGRGSKPTPTKIIPPRVIPPTRGHGPPPPNRPVYTPTVESYPGAGAAAAAGKRAVAATPAPALPRVPIIANPTQRQITAATTTISTTLSRVSKARGQGPAQTMRQLAADPRTRHFAKAASHYARAQERHTAAYVGSSVVRKADEAAAARPLPAGYQSAAVQAGLTVPYEIGKGPSRREAQIVAGRAIAAGQQQRDRYSPDRRDRRVRVGVGPVSLATINASATRRALLGATSLGADTAENRFVRNAFGDLKTLGEGPFIGAVQAGEAVVQGYKQHPGLIALPPPLGPAVAFATAPKGQELAKGTAQQVAQSSPAALLTGHPVLAGQRFVQHPLLAALDYSAVGSIVGHTAGALARAAGSTAEAGGLRGALARGGSRVRPPLALSDDPHGGYVSRDYSGSSVKKAGQILADAHREPVLDEHGKPVKIEDRGRKVPLLKMHPFEQTYHAKGEANFDAARANAVERAQRDEAIREGTVPKRDRRKAFVGKVQQPGLGFRRKLRDVVSMVTEGTVTSVKHFESDLRAHRDRIQRYLDEDALHTETDGAQGVEHYNSRSQRTDAEKRITLADSILNDPKAMARAKDIVAEGERHGRRLRGGDVKIAERFPDEAERMRRAALIDTAVEHMGARHFTVEEHGRLENAARQEESAARTRVEELSKAHKENPTPQGAADLRRARAELTTARNRRIAVSGRDPRLVNQHEILQAQARNAKAKHQAAQAKVARLEKELKALTDKQSVRGGGEAARRMGHAAGQPTRARGVLAHIEEVLRDEQKFKRAERQQASYEKRKKELETEIKQARAEAGGARETRQVAEQKARESKMPPAQAAVRTAQGEHLPTSEIEDFLRSRGRDPGSVAYLPAKSGYRQSFHQQFRPGSRGGIGKGRRTGAAHLAGKTEASADLLREAGVRNVVIVNRAESIDKMIGDRGRRHPAWEKARSGQQLTRAERRIVQRGGYFTGPEADELIKALDKKGEDWVAVTAHPQGLSAEAKAVIEEDLQGPAGLPALGEHLLHDRVLQDPAAAPARARNVVLVRRAYIEQLQKHLAPAGEIQHFFQMLTRPFRFAVLTQPKWIVGNFVEPYLIRLGVAGSGLTNVFGLAVDMRAAAKVLPALEKLDPRAAREVSAQQYGGLFGGNRGAAVRRTLEESGIVRWGTAIRDLPVVRQAVDLAKFGLDAYFRVNRVIEAGAQHAGLGRQARKDIQDITGSWLKSITLGDKAAKEAARGLVNTATQRRFMRAQHVLLGKYEGFSPWLRRLTQSFMPFVPWALNAARFVYWTMPIHHPALTSLLTKTNQAVSQTWQDEHANLPPGSLKLAIPNGKGGWVDLARYTPYGFTGPIVENDLNQIPSQLLPQIRGALEAISGRDPFGRDLMVAPTADNPKGTPNVGQKIGIAGYDLAEAITPYLSMLRRFREGGATPYAGSNVLFPSTKPNTATSSAARRIFDPFRPTYLNAPSAGGADLAPTPAPVARPGGSRLDQLRREAAQRRGRSSAGQDRLLQLRREAARRRRP